MITLTSNRLRVEISEPGEAPNNNFRFDRAGFISEVVLDGTVRYCASEPRNLSHRCSGGRGLCNMYTHNSSEEVEVGEYFPKLGVGIYKKENEGKFQIFSTVKEYELFPIEVEATEDTAVFKTGAIECNGYAMSTVKTVEVEGNTITMTVKATNEGTRDIDTREYCHNFISIDGMAVSSDYRLEMPSITDKGYLRLRNRSGAYGSLRGDGKGYTFCEMSALSTDTAITAEEIEPTVPFVWKLSHLGARASVTGEEFFVPSNISVWAADHMMCPEIFHQFVIKPGESHEWKRRWTFEADAE